MSVMFSCDYSTVELCTLSQNNIWLQGYSRMGEAINAGKDLHMDVGSGLMGLEYAAAVALYEGKDKFAKDMRQASKALNFGFPGGLGGEAMVQYAKANYGISLCVAVDRAEKCGIHKHASKSKKSKGKLICSACVATAQRLKNEWLRKWEEMPGYFDIITRLTEGPDGGRVQIPGPGTDVGVERGGCFFTEGANCKFQGLAARGGKKAVFYVSKEAYCDRKSPIYGVRVNVFAHDEIIGEIPIHDHVHEAVNRVSEIMVERMQYFTPDITIKAPPALMVRWLKGAEPEFDENGRLIPCAICPVCSGLGVVGWDGKFRTSAAHPGGKQRGHKTPKNDDGSGGEACNYDGPACPADLRTLGVA